MPYRKQQFKKLNKDIQEKIKAYMTHHGYETIAEIDNKQNLKNLGFS